MKWFLTLVKTQARKKISFLKHEICFPTGGQKQKQVVCIGFCNQKTFLNLCCLKLFTKTTSNISFHFRNTLDYLMQENYIKRNIKKTNPMCEIKDRSSEQITPAWFRTVAGNFIVTQVYYEIEVIINKIKFNHSFFRSKAHERRLCFRYRLFGSSYGTSEIWRLEILHHGNGQFTIAQAYRPL
jgi:hypothetical protein